MSDKKIKQLKVDIYCHIIKKTQDFAGLEILLDTLDKPFWREELENMEVWPVLLPPTEGFSSPYDIQWSRWAKIFKGLQKFFPRLRALVIDDFNWFNPLFEAQNAVTPDLTDFHTGQVHYDVGETVQAPDWDATFTDECGHALHCSPHLFLTHHYAQEPHVHIEVEVNVKDIRVVESPSMPASGSYGFVKRLKEGLER